MTVADDRGRIVPPNLDDRSWQDLVDEMRALIPRYAPQWTDHNPSDLGVALIELFAWLAEGVVFRLNRVPEKNFLAFLNLLGVTRDPVAPAGTFLTFAAGAKSTVPAGTRAQTVPPTGGAGAVPPIVFETDDDVTVLPVALTDALVVGPFATNAASSTYAAVKDLVGPPAATYPLNLPANQVSQVCFGFDKASAEEVLLRLRLYRPAPGPGQVTAAWVYSKGTTEPLAWPAVPTVSDSTEALTHDGSVRLMLPGDWAAQQPSVAAMNPPGTGWSTVTASDPNATVTRPRFWIGVRVANTTGVPLTIGVDRTLFNAAPAHHALSIRAAEALGGGTGQPFQVVPLANRPLYRQPGTAPYAHLAVQVGTGNPAVFQTWTQVADLPAGPGQVYKVDPVTAEVSFGNFDDQTGLGHGSMPPAGSQIRALTYRYVVGGAAGNVAADRLTVLGPTPQGGLPAGITAVTNLAPARDGADEEPVDDALRRAPQQLKIRDRAITAADYEFLAAEATNDVVIARALPPRLQDADAPGGTAWKKGDPWQFAGIQRAPGVVNVVVVPDQGLAVAQPQPTPDLVRTVQAHLDQRRDLTGRVVVTGPRYLPVIVQVDLIVWQRAIDAGADRNQIKADTLGRIKRFLHPTRGGADGTGWQVEQPVFVSDLFSAIMPNEDIGFISGLQVKADIPVYHFPPLNPAGTAGNYNAGLERPFPLSPLGATVRIADYELVCAAADNLHVITTTVPAS
ncbi:putative baseplate assembly protein [Dactylosporangium sp. McL0621]|uniref:putative baseplate assembly protein n=1 Tax=Dactylosporangium sp. McL0621 TaxID=3415678 RepID=UPI003CFB129B